MLFRNVGRKYYNAAGGDGGAGGGSGAPAPGAAPAPAPGAAPAIDYAQLAAAIVAAQAGGGAPAPAPGGAPAPAGESAYEKMKREEAERATSQAAQNEMRGQVAFDMGFDAMLTSNQALFGTMTAAKIRDSAAGLEGADLVHHLRCVSAQAFLGDEANHIYLNPADLAYAKAAIIGKHDRQVDSPKAWEVIERALHVAGVKARADDVRNNGGAGAGNNMPHLTAWIQKCKNRFAHNRNDKKD